MTVSRVLNGTVNVSDEMRGRVLRAISELSYVPNEVARLLRQQRGRKIGVIVPNIRDSFFAICSHAMSEVAKAHDYSVAFNALSTLNLRVPEDAAFVGFDDSRPPTFSSP